MMAPLIVFLLYLLSISCNQLPQIECSNSLDYLCQRESATKQAIYTLHKLLDSDKDGGISPKETNGFAIEELKNTVPSERVEKLYELDVHINPEELWFVWKNSEIFNWTTEDVKKWLIEQVELPQYAEVFLEHHVDGKSLPLLIMPHSDFLTNTLGIKNLVHKQKIILKATDVILFGKQINKFSFYKDSLLITCIVLVITMGYFGFRKVSLHKSQMMKISKELEKMALLERSMTELQKVLDESQSEKRNLPAKYPLFKKPSALQLTKIEESLASAKQISQEELAKESSKEIEFLRQILAEKQQQLEAVLRRAAKTIARSSQVIDDRGSEDSDTTPHFHLNGDDSTISDLKNYDSEIDECSLNNEESGLRKISDERGYSYRPLALKNSNATEWIYYSQEKYSIELRLWLQISYEVEMNYYNTKRASAERQLKEAKAACEKLNRKQKSFIGTLRIAHFSAMEDLHCQINSAKETLDEIRQDLDENRQRWNEIQRLFGIQLIPTPGLSVLRNNLNYYRQAKDFQSISRKANLEIAQKKIKLTPSEKSNLCSSHSSASNLSELRYRQSPPTKACCLHDNVIHAT